MTAETTRPVILRAVGDVALIGRSARSLIHGSDPTWHRTAEFLADADITFANFEMPIATSSVQPAAADVSREFLGVPASLPGFLLAGVDIVALATNHVMDWGERGLVETIDRLRERGVRVVGAGRNLDEAVRGVVLERAGLRVGFVAFTPSQRWTATKSKPGAAPLRLELVRQALDSLSGADVKIVSIHWGLEMSNYPTPEDRDLAADIVGAGADMILGHHPHVIQGVERIQQSWVTYSMGNFIFDIEAGRVKRSFDPWDLRAGYIVDARLTNGGVESFEAVPVFIGDSGLGAIADGRLRDEIAHRIRTASERIEQGSRNVWEYAGSRVVVHRLKCLRCSLRDGGFGAVMKELSHLRPRHAKLLWGFVVSRLRRRARG